MSMNGNFARSTLCSGVTSVDLGWYSSMVGVRCSCEDCFCWFGWMEAAGSVAAARDRTNNRIAAAKITARSAKVRQDLIACLGRKNCPTYLPTRRRDDVRLGVCKLTNGRNLHQ